MLKCKRCLYPSSKPDLQIFSDGLCAACHSFDNRESIDYTKRKLELVEILEKYRSKDGSRHDCIVPSSGGKDSTTQALRVRELGFNPLIVTVTTDHLTTIGRANIENLKNLGFDCIEITPNPVIRRKINKFALETVGDISWPEHLLIFTVPIRVAVQMKIPLLIWGEQSQNEYGGPASAAESNVLDRRWLEEFGGLNGLRVSEVGEMVGAKPEQMIPYQYPTDEELKEVGVTGLFLGYYTPWDGYQNALYAQAHGFQSYPHCVEGSLACYENVDNAQTGIHDYFKYLKYGFGRATDIACNHIRRGRLTREDAVRMVELHDGRYPSSYLGIPLEEILKPIGMTKAEFDKVCERFTNRKIFPCSPIASSPSSSTVARS